MDGKRYPVPNGEFTLKSETVNNWYAPVLRSGTGDMGMVGNTFKNREELLAELRSRAKG